MNERDKDGETPLHRAARGPYHPKPDSQGRKRNSNVPGRVPLANYSNAVECLIEQCANKYIKDHNGKTPLDIAMHMYTISQEKKYKSTEKKGYKRIIELLKS